MLMNYQKEKDGCICNPNVLNNKSWHIFLVSTFAAPHHRHEPWKSAPWIKLLFFINFVHCDFLRWINKATSSSFSCM
jgi:hypothetical protein